MMRLFRRGGDLGRVDLSEPHGVAPDKILPVALRNGELARWISDASDAPIDAAADDLPRLLGLSLGRARLAKALFHRPAHDDPSLSARLAAIFEMELQAASDALSGGVPAKSVTLVAAQFGPVSVTAAPRVYLLSRRLQVFGGRTLGEAMADALTGRLERLTPVAPIGPLRLQTERAISELRDPTLAARRMPELDIPPVAGSEAAQAFRDHFVRELIDRGLVPRLVGTFRRPDQPIFVVAYDYPARSKRDLAVLRLKVLSMLNTMRERIGRDSLDVDERPLAIDFWLIRNGKLARNIGWRQLGDPDADAEFVKRTMISFVESPETTLPLEAVGHPIETRPRTVQSQPSSLEIPWLVPFVRYLSGLQMEELGLLAMVQQELPASVGVMHATIHADVATRLRADGKWEPYAIRTRKAAFIVHEAIDAAIANVGFTPPEEHRRFINNAVINLAFALAVRPELESAEFEALWQGYEEVLPDLHRLRWFAFSIGTTAELDQILRTPGLAEIALIQGDVSFGVWDLRCPTCGNEFIPFVWHDWRTKSLNFCERCPTIAYRQLNDDDPTDPVKFMQIFPSGSFDPSETETAQSFL